jgi:hypothetical protein
MSVVATVGILANVSVVATVGVLANVGVVANVGAVERCVLAPGVADEFSFANSCHCVAVALPSAL